MMIGIVKISQQGGISRCQSRVKFDRTKSLRRKGVYQRRAEQRSGIELTPVKRPVDADRGTLGRFCRIEEQA